MIYPTEYFTLDVKDIKINENELKRRLSVSKDFDIGIFDKCIENTVASSSPKCCFTYSDARVLDGGKTDIGFCTLESYDFAKNMKDCTQVYTFAVTLGLGNDRFLSKLSLVSQSEFFICDAISSALIESVADVAEDTIKKDMPSRPRFSPGYGDMALDVQREILSVLNAQKLLGITLSKSLLMTPQKSITALLPVMF